MFLTHYEILIPVHVTWHKPPPRCFKAANCPLVRFLLFWRVVFRARSDVHSLIQLSMTWFEPHTHPPYNGLRHGTRPCCVLIGAVALATPHCSYDDTLLRFRCCRGGGLKEAAQEAHVLYTCRLLAGVQSCTFWSPVLSATRCPSILLVWDCTPLHSLSQPGWRVFRV